jgi:hypothetical protein
MIVLLDTSHDLEVCSQELGCEVGQLLTPLTGFRLRDPTKPWAIDNGAFSGFDEKAFFSRLRRQAHDKVNCKFVCAPDVLGQAMRTAELFEWFKPRIAGSGWPIALVVQDMHELVRIPWYGLDAIFVGGSTAWKVGPHAAACIQTAKALGKWVHVGRINDPARFQYFEDLGVDSCDGSGISQYSHMRDAIRRRADSPQLFSA